jgi:ring-1,2-phenylacetyl-CoA epoxidase subunit PaaE
VGRADFYPLTVAAVDPLTDDSAAITFGVPSALREVFAFAPGQFLTVRRGDERRSYSICVPCGSAACGSAACGSALRIGVREVPGGAVSGWLVRRVRPGDVVEVQPPSGTFTPGPPARGDHVLIAAGSGITPLLSIASSLLAAGSRVSLVYGNRRADTVMFADDVADLKDRFTGRMLLVHVLSREAREIDLFTGRLDAEKLRVLLPLTADVGSVRDWWLCGPYGMVAGAVEVLTGFGVPRPRIHRELFYVEDSPPAPVRHAGPETAMPDTAGPDARVTVILDGRSTVVAVPPGTPVLDGARRIRADLPFACKAGVCGTCRAVVREGKVTMRRNYALEEPELAAGYVLTCQSLPVTETVTVDYDG